MRWWTREPRIWSCLQHGVTGWALRRLFFSVQLELANQESVEGTVCSPVRIEIEGFRPIFSEVIFVDMLPDNGDCEPLVEYIVLEQGQAAVAMLGHRLVHVKRLDLK